MLANDSDTDGDPMTVESVTQPADGTVEITNSGADLYEPDPGYGNDAYTTDDFTYTLNGGSEATVAVTANCVDDPPTAVDDSYTVYEDRGPFTFKVRRNDTDPDAGPITVIAVSDSEHGGVAVGSGGNNVTYTPDPDYCNPHGTLPLDTFTYTLDGGSEATVSVRVRCVDDPPTADDPPVAVADSYVIRQGTGAKVFSVRRNDTDTDGGLLTVIAVTDGSHGTVAITGGGNNVTYTPDPGYCNPQGTLPLDTFTYTLNGGSETTVSIRVRCAA